MTTQLPDIDIILNPQPDLTTWRTIPRELEQAGFHGLVCPDNPWSADPFQLMAIAASVTTTLRLATHVLAAPLREPTEVVDQTRSRPEPLRRTSPEWCGPRMCLRSNMADRCDLWPTP